MHIPDSPKMVVIQLISSAGSIPNNNTDHHYVHEKDRHRPDENIKDDQIPPSNAFPGPNAMVVQLLDADSAVFAVTRLYRSLRNLAHLALKLPDFL